VKKQLILVQFSLLEFKIHNSCDDMYFTPHLITLLNYIFKVKTTKMRMNTNSTFNINSKVAVKYIKLHWQFHKMF